MKNGTTNGQPELPYDSLTKLGLSREVLETMPSQFVDALKRGEITPLVKTSVVASNGTVVSLPLRMQVVKDELTGASRLVTYPSRSAIDNRVGLSRYELEAVKDGNTVNKELLLNGKKQMTLVQYDGRTNSLVHASADSLHMEKRLRELESIHDIQLGTQQKEQIRNGRPVELSVGDRKVTVGVDLRDPHHFKIVNGDMDEWKRLNAERYDLAHPEVMGFVKTDRNRWEYQQVVNRHSNADSLNMKGHEKAASMHI